jgi:hypothetical protein
MVNIGLLQKLGEGREGSGSFLKKRTKKLLPVGARSFAGGTRQMDKSFLLLFFKKEALPFMLQALINAQPPSDTGR